MGGIILTGFWLVASALGIGLGLTVYGLPTIIAIWRKSPNIVLIAVVNLALGGLFVPWWIALGMALWSSERQGGVMVIQATNVPPAPYAALPAVAQSSARFPVQGALPAAPPAQPSALSPPAGKREDSLSRQQPSSAPAGFVPPAPYGESSPASYRPPSDRGW